MSREAISDAVAAVLGRDHTVIPGLSDRLLKAFDLGRRHKARLLAAFIAGDAEFRKAHRKDKFRRFVHAEAERVMWPETGSARGWNLPRLTTLESVARWLGVEWKTLQWMADGRGMEARFPDGPLRHYRCRWIKKRSGSARLIESPKARLKELQRKLLREVLDPIPPHESAHAFRRGRSIVTFTTPHAGKAMVLRMDLRDFFPGIRRERIVGLFLIAGYPEPVARLLANLCCTTTPPDVLQECPAELPADQVWGLRKLYQEPHLPQGAPTSPALANLCAYRLDCRLAGFAKRSAARYTRYADDLVFSGGPEFARGAGSLFSLVSQIIVEEGFHLHPRKTRMMRASAPQQVAGLIVNAHPNVCRSEFDRLKATLHNCVRTGLAEQNRGSHPDFRAHLLGRIAHVEMVNPRRGKRLRGIFEQIPP